MKKTLIVATIIGIIIIGFSFYLFTRPSAPASIANPVPVQMPPSKTVSTEAPQPIVDKTKTIIGKSVEKRDIFAYHYGTGGKEILFVGGIHGGYEWNTTLVAYELMDYLAANPSMIPANIMVTVIPVLNPDGLHKVTGKDGRFVPADVAKTKETVIAGRYNANGVDLNRNFDCEWQPQGTWMNTAVSGGKAAFSEAESQAFKNYIGSRNPSAVIVWYSSVGGVFSSNCHNGVIPETKTLTDLYAKASGYKAYERFDFYEITGDMVNWLAKNNIPAISVLLTTHQDTEWDKNLAGIKAVLKHYAR